MSAIFAFLSGLVFGIGLLLAGMVNPAKVIGFLDLAGAWDPSLGLVMAGAIGVGVFGFAWARRRTLSLVGEPMQMPVATRIDKRLAGGNLLFGIGWGLAGICPGPGLVLLGAGMAEGWIFVASMVAGMLVFEALERMPGGVASTRGA